MGFTDIGESQPGSRRFIDLYTGKRLIAPQPMIGLPDSALTIAEFIRDNVDADYATGHFGKWHLGAGGPGQHGFEAHDGSTGNHNLAAHSADPNPKDVFGVTGRAIAFMRSQVNSKRPFFLQVSHYANHVPLTALESTIDKYRNKLPGIRHDNPIYAALNENLDSSIGSLMAELGALGIADNTFVIYTSDNGGSKNIKNPSTNNAPLREGKTWVYEGGIRVPFMLSGPGIEPGQSDQLVIGWDVFPTVCAMAGCQGPLPDGLEGGSLLDLAVGAVDHIQRPNGDALFWHFPHYLSAKGTTPQSAVRAGKYKLIRFDHDQHSELYDLSNDIGEQRDIAQEFPEIVVDLEEKLDAHLAMVSAKLAGVNKWAGGYSAAPGSDYPRLSVANFAPLPQLKSQHTSVFNKISYRIPQAWSVTDGETDWIAESDDKQFWQKNFDPTVDSYFMVSKLPPFLALTDRELPLRRTLLEMVAATVQSMAATAAVLDYGPIKISLDAGREALLLGFELEGGRRLEQLFFADESGDMISVAGNVPEHHADKVRSQLVAIGLSVNSQVQQ